MSTIKVEETLVVKNPITLKSLNKAIVTFVSGYTGTIMPFLDYVQSKYCLALFACKCNPSLGLGSISPWSQVPPPLPGPWSRSSRCWMALATTVLAAWGPVILSLMLTGWAWPPETRGPCLPQVCQEGLLVCGCIILRFIQHLGPEILPTKMLTSCCSCTYGMKTLVTWGADRSYNFPLLPNRRNWLPKYFNQTLALLPQD